MMEGKSDQGGKESTLGKTGHRKYGGWSREGTARFNHFYNLVQVNRASPLAETMEKHILQYCKAQKYANEGGDDAVQQDEGGTNEGLGVLDLMVPVEAYWDLEDRYELVAPTW